MNQLTDLQRAALRLAETWGWGVAVEARDGAQVTLRHGQPGRKVVLTLTGGDRGAK